MEVLAWRRCGHIGTPLTRVVPHRELHLRPQWTRSHGAAAPISAHPSYVSYTIGSSTFGSCGGGGAGVAPARSFLHTSRTFRTPQGAPPSAPVKVLAWSHRPRLVALLTCSLPHREFHLRPRRGAGAGPLRPFRRTPRTLRAPWGTSPTASVEVLALAPPRPFRHTPHTCRAPQKAPPTAPRARSHASLRPSLRSALWRTMNGFRTNCLPSLP